MISATSPNQEGVAGTDSEEAWMITEESAILVISTSLLGTMLFYLIKEAYFYARSLLVSTSRCAIRGLLGLDASSIARPQWHTAADRLHLYVQPLPESRTPPVTGGWQFST